VSIQTYEAPPPAVADNTVTRWASILAPAAQLADRIANTEFVPGAMRGKPDVITAAIMYGDEIGVGPMQALASIHVVDGRPAPSSELMRALIFRQGHAIGIEYLSGERCRMWGRRAGQAESTTIEWTIDMARSAGLTDKAVWRRYPRALLLARCSSELARVMFPDVIKGLGHLTDDEATVGDFDTWATSVPDTEPKRATVRRRRQPEALPEAASAPEPPREPPPVDNPSPAIAGASTGVRGDDGPGYEMPAATELPDPWDGADPWATGDTEAGPAVPPDAPPGRRVVDTPLPETPLPPADDAAPSDPDGKPSDRLLRAVFAGLNRIGAADDDALRHGIASAILGRPVTTYGQLTKRDCLKMVGALSDLETGLTSLSIADNGTVTIEPGRDHDG
jgi:hypothetical protein